jgi:hypothetical protein
MVLLLFPTHLDSLQINPARSLCSLVRLLLALDPITGCTSMVSRRIAALPSLLPFGTPQCSATRDDEVEA